MQGGSWSRTITLTSSKIGSGLTGAGEWPAEAALPASAGRGASAREGGLPRALSCTLNYLDRVGSPDPREREALGPRRQKYPGHVPLVARPVAASAVELTDILEEALRPGDMQRRAPASQWPRAEQDVVIDAGEVLRVLVPAEVHQCIALAVSGPEVAWQMQEIVEGVEATVLEVSHELLSCQAVGKPFQDICRDRSGNVGIGRRLDSLAGSASTLVADVALRASRTLWAALCCRAACHPSRATLCCTSPFAFRLQLLPAVRGPLTSSSSRLLPTTRSPFAFSSS
eukprot:CAMPEP_0179208206 /NCGR_PEP_ID=MMETSP0796-20121207/103832_1 /TAXON_ID=73915 /ORGANISM="Pyrodinium bahamense, Strain pbaha01" /LENGTH=284 /DNA_ID=CAMNT_0020913153 /DNA_START=100 /DNA_END=955 /DNA_ORIENTATION=+